MSGDSFTGLHTATSANSSGAGAGTIAGSDAYLNDQPYNTARREQALWRAVIVQALMDASCGSKKQEAQQAKQEAIVWLRGNSKDFMTVCYYAGFEPDYVRRMVRDALERGCQWRALPGQGKRKRPLLRPRARCPGQRR